jgi:hypothetical protein
MTRELWAPNQRAPENHSLSPAGAQVWVGLWIAGIGPDQG